MKGMAIRGKGDRELDGDHRSHPVLLKFVYIVSFLVVFVAGIILGLLTNSRINRYLALQGDLFNNINCPIVEACREEVCLSMDTFMSPKNLTHGMSDEELLWRASLVPHKEDFPFKRVPKVAFMFLTRGPLPFHPLWERFFHGHSRSLFSIYVHALPGYQLNASRDSVFYGRQVPSADVEWGTSKLTDAERRLLANALLDFSNERFILISESCIPIYNFQTVYKYLISSDHSFVEIYDDPSNDGRGRYSRQMLPYITLPQWRKGSQWFEINREMASYIVSDTMYYSLFKKYCKPACYPDEHYIQTFVHIFHASKSMNRSITWVNWSQGGPHPARFEADGVTEAFLQSIRKNSTMCRYNSGMTSLCYLFARKFAPNALDALLNLTSTLLEF